MTLSQALEDPKTRVKAIEDGNLQKLSHDYLPYAVLAADAYREPNTREERLALLEQMKRPENTGKTEKTDNDPVYDPKYGGKERFVDLWPVTPDHCKDKRKDEPTVHVPLCQVVKKECWERALEIEKYAPIKGWSVYVPDLRIEVWRRGFNNSECKRDPLPKGEYAIVFRGTIPDRLGGWLSNFRGFTALPLKIFWDQYKQAYDSTQRILEQIDLVECFRKKGYAYCKAREDKELQEEPKVSDNDRRSQMPLPVVLEGSALNPWPDPAWIRGSLEPSRRPCAEPKVGEEWHPQITAVGHSLGAGIAKYVFYKVPDITKVIGFNPSPIDGTLTIDVDRKDVLCGRTEASMFFLYEQSEILTSAFGCHSGPAFGRDGGPVSLCQKGNLLSGGLVGQHDMSQMACALAFVSKDNPNANAIRGATASE